MASRPEENPEYGASYDAYDGRGSDAYRDFVPYRPGNQPAHPSFMDDVRSAAASFFERSERPDGPGGGSSHQLRPGDAVRNINGLGGVLGGEVPAGTKGQVVSVEHGLMSERITVEFDNGYRQTLDSGNLKYESGWY